MMEALVSLITPVKNILKFYYKKEKCMKKYKMQIADDGTGMFCGNPCNLCEVKNRCLLNENSDVLNDEERRLVNLMEKCRDDESLSYCIVGYEEETIP